MKITVTSATDIPVGTPIRPGGEMTFDGFEGLVGTITRAEVSLGGLLEVDVEIDEESRLAYLLRKDVADHL